ncbi:MAG: peptide chain release factor 3 [Deltaproteobacteria bacterium]|nr:peptide chain release factor 3 [Deltaproteobacteria bacterium]
MNTPDLILQKEVLRRRTFAIISHPDAGKTTLTEKLLLYGGAIHLAGAVKAKANQRHTTSDWMALERQRGISISTSVLQFEYGGHQINLLDTPGHRDFSEDTYRTLTAADAAVMLIDAAKGVEPQTRKLFEVCRMRGIPIFTFMNKLDRPSREPFDLMDELEKVLGIRSCSISWPIGMGDRFKGVYDRQTQEVLLFQKEGEANVKGKLQAKKFGGIDDPALTELMGEEAARVKSELELVELAGDPFDRERVRACELTPVFFGSAMNNFGVQHFLERFIEMAPAPFARKTAGGSVEAAIEPTRKGFSGFIFKIQANMDPQHRDRVAFLRVCSGRFYRNVAARHARLEKDVKLSKPLQFFARERVLIDEAWPGDIVGLLDTSGELRIGDTLYESDGGKGEVIRYEGVPRFPTEHFAAVMILDPMKRKQLKKGLDQLSEEGVVQVYSQPGLGDKDPVLGAVGALQFEVLQHRLKAEYGVDARIEKLPYLHARWLDGTGIDYFKNREDSRLLEDRDANPVVLFKTDWSLRWAEDNCKDVKFLKTAPLK